MDKKVVRQRKNFRTRLLYANKKIREVHFAMMNTKHKTNEEVVKKLQFSKGKTKLSYPQNLTECYD